MKNVNFTFLLTSNGQEWQFHFITDIAAEISSMRGHVYKVYYVILLLRLVFWQVMFSGKVLN